MTDPWKNILKFGPKCCLILVYEMIITLSRPTLLEQLLTARKTTIAYFNYNPTPNNRKNAKNGLLITLARSKGSLLNSKDSSWSLLRHTLQSN